MNGVVDCTRFFEMHSFEITPRGQSLQAYCDGKAIGVLIGISDKLRE